MVQRSIIPGSERVAPEGKDAGPVVSDERAQVSIYLQDTGKPREAGGGGRRFRTRSELRTTRETESRESIAAVKSFLRTENLTVVDEHAGRRWLKAEGTLSDLQHAFGAELRMYQREGRSFRARSGALSAPGEVAPIIEAVLGLDQRPVATAKSIRLAHRSATAGFLPNAVTALYGFPKTAGSGAGECIAIIELGGGFNDADISAAFQAMDLKPPTVTAVAVSGGTNAPGKNTDADGEVGLDIQIAGAGAPGATLAVYFAPNTDQGFVDAISQAAHDDTHKPSVMSISWGSAESDWTQQAISAMTSAFQDAATLGISVFAASGDGLAADGASDGKAHVDFPASSPYVVGCGGTRLHATAQHRSSETVWNSDGGGTGGGVSDLFAVPAYQTRVKLPMSANSGGRKGRGVPDVAGDADPNTGYRVIIDGQAQVIGGTSAVAPLWAGLFALINEAAGHPSGQPHAILYAHPEAFHDVTKGDNKVDGVGYSASKGWDACTGLGAPHGQAVAALFRE